MNRGTSGDFQQTAVPAEQVHPDAEGPQPCLEATDERTDASRQVGLTERLGQVGLDHVTRHHAAPAGEQAAKHGRIDRR
jgi:hypothetical protein